MMDLTDMILFGKAINGGGDDGVKIMLIESVEDVECMVPLEDSTLYHLGSYIPTPTELGFAVMGVNANTGEYTGFRRMKDYDFEYSFIDLSEEAGFPLYQFVDDAEATLMVVVGRDMEEEGNLIKAGTYISSVFTAFPLPTMLVFGV